MDSQIEKIRASLSLFDAWRILDLPGTPRTGDIRSPFRKDLRPSFSIYQAKNHLRFWDHATGQGGDCVDLWAKAKGITVKEAVSQILGLLKPGTPPQTRANAPVARFDEAPGIRWPPDIRTPTMAECRDLGKLRNITAGAFDLAARLGTLRVATLYQRKCWILTDPRGRAAAARRFDGELFPSGKKSFALPGSKKDWPPGLATACPQFDLTQNVLLVEGEPDYFAALALAIHSDINFRPAAMLGAGCKLGPDALQAMQNKNVLIIPHNDTQGQSALAMWVEQLSYVQGVKIKSQQLPFEDDDLNDFIKSANGLEPLELLKGFNAKPHTGAQ